jgi:site-specific recombinase
MKINKVFLLVLEDNERNMIAETIPWLREHGTPIAADNLQNILDRYDDGEALTARDIEDIRIWLNERKVIDIQQNEIMWRAVR